MNARRRPLAGAITAGLVTFAAGSLQANLEPESGIGPNEPLRSESLRADTQQLSEQQLQDLRRNVLRRCALSSKIDQNKLPWYFHYEFGVALLNAGDAERSLEALQLGANLRQEPKRDKRMYGMWYIDYLPYFQIARAHSRLGEWEEASAAIQLSDELEHISRRDYAFDSYSELRARIAEQTGISRQD
jgi:hypothetical protein